MQHEDPGGDYVISSLLLVRVPFWLCPLELTSSIVLVILDEERDGVKHILLSHIVPLGVVICFFDVIMFYTGVLT